MALVAALCLLGLASACGAAQSKADAQLAAITGGCKVALDLEHAQDAGPSLIETQDGCRAAIKTWMAVGSAGAGGAP